MKRILAMILVLILGIGAVCPMASAEETFVPSISYKDGPTVEDAQVGGENVESCIIVSSVTDAREQSTDIHQQERDLLLNLYKGLSDGSMELPLETDHVVRELVAVSFQRHPCVESGHSHEEQLKHEDVDMTVDFDLGIPDGVVVTVLVYSNGQWNQTVEAVSHNGIITVELEDTGILAFCVDPADVEQPSGTGDPRRCELMLWILVLIVSCLILLLLLFLRRRKKKAGSEA